jgi:hypothetical protein
LDARRPFETGIPCEHCHGRLGKRTRGRKIGKRYIPRGTGRGVWFWCGRWTCRGCAERLKAKWAGHICELLKNAPTPHVFRGTEADLKALVKECHRVRPDYVAVRGDGKAVLISDTPLSGTTPSTAGEALGAAVAALASVRVPLFRAGPRKGPGRAYHRRVWTSRGWQLPKQPARNEHRDMGPMNRTPAGAAEVADRHGVEVEDWGDTARDGEALRGQSYFRPPGVRDGEAWDGVLRSIAGQGDAEPADLYQPPCRLEE